MYQGLTTITWSIRIIWNVTVHLHDLSETFKTFCKTARNEVERQNIDCQAVSIQNEPLPNGNEVHTDSSHRFYPTNVAFQPSEIVSTITHTNILMHVRYHILALPCTPVWFTALFIVQLTSLYIFGSITLVIQNFRKYEAFQSKNLGRMTLVIRNFRKYDAAIPCYRTTTPLVERCWIKWPKSPALSEMQWNDFGTWHWFEIISPSFSTISM